MFRKSLNKDYLKWMSWIMISRILKKVICSVRSRVKLKPFGEHVICEWNANDALKKIQIQNIKKEGEGGQHRPEPLK